MPTLLKNSKFRQILGLKFFNGSASEAVDMLQHGGLLVVPSAPCLRSLPFDSEYREAALNADLLITDSAFMVLLWNLLQRDYVQRLSGLEYLRTLLRHPGFHSSDSFWIMASPESAATNISWLQTQGIEVAPDDYYVAPIYGSPIQDEVLLQRLHERHPKHIVVTIGGGSQERLGLYLKRNMDYAASIYCIGAAIAFLSGDQVHIPNWADRFYLGWLFRCFSDPKRYGSRYWEARHLFSLLLEYRERLPRA